MPEEQSLSRKQRVVAAPVHPFLFGAYAVFFLWGQNVDKVNAGDVVAPLLIVLVGTGAVHALAWLVLRSPHKAAIAVSLLSFLFFSFGHVAGSSVIHAQQAATASPHLPLWLSLWAGLAIVGLLALVITRHEGRRLAIVLNGAVGLLLLGSMATVGLGLLRLDGGASIAGAEAAVPEPAVEDARDIYLIVMDRYPSRETLREQYGHDNAEFLEGLEDRGFYVASRSRAPYPKTPHSIQTTLNMEYIDDLPADSGNWRLVFDKLKNPAAVRFLKPLGYRYVFMGSRNHSIRSDSAADLNIWWDPSSGPAISEFGQVLYNSTVLSAIAERYEVSFLDTRWQEYQRALFQYRELRNVSKIEGPTFTFAHLLITHPPYVFDERCGFASGSEVEEEGLDRAFLQAVDCAGRKTLELIDELQAVPEPERPIIVIQSDEGPGPDGWEPGTKEKYDWTEAPQATLEEKFGILNAYYLPGVDEPDLHPGISPVNTFRVIFGHYFDAELPLLADRSYIFRSEAEPYRFIDVTDRVR